MRHDRHDVPSIHEDYDSVMRDYPDMTEGRRSHYGVYDNLGKTLRRAVPIDCPDGEWLRRRQWCRGPVGET